MSFRVQDLVVVGSVLAVALGVVKTLTSISGGGQGPDDSMLKQGQPVVLSVPRGAAVRTTGTTGHVDLRGGTPCQVIVDFAVDRSDCHDRGRRVMVRVIRGDRAGEVVTVPRSMLRPSWVRATV